MAVRCDLAACYRLFVKFGWTDLIFTHLSARVPGTTDQYLINPYGLLFDEITASNLIKVDLTEMLFRGLPVQSGGSCHSHRSFECAARGERRTAQPHAGRCGGVCDGRGVVATVAARHGNFGSNVLSSLRLCA